jgi:hypothetical protein
VVLGEDGWYWGRMGGIGGGWVVLQKNLFNSNLYKIDFIVYYYKIKSRINNV